ncbi:hypothetical protein [Limosilactobacillus gastricus]|uniref:hypothetical protein n=1 Tax=Limosilactobacillus gastricus TaxID=227942 RepID=UPI0026EE85B6|nr:hypothetical protein [Limosilactobacillus gastricus]
MTDLEYLEDMEKDLEKFLPDLKYLEELEKDLEEALTLAEEWKARADQAEQNEQHLREQLQTLLSEN